MSKGLVYICMDEGFPYVNAASRYVLCEAKAIMHAGYEVKVFGLGMERESDWNEDKGFYEVEGIRYENINYNFKNIINKIFFGEYVAKHLKGNIQSAGNVSHVIVYSLSFLFVNSIKRKIKSIGIPVSFNIVEWCLPSDCRHGIFNLHYLNMWACFNYLIKTKANVIVISKLLENIFKNNGNTYFVLPPLVDTDNYAFNPENKKSGRIKIIYPGLPAIKEAFDIMLGGLNHLSRDERKALQFIMTGCSREALEDILGKDEYLLNDLSDCMEILNFLPYDDLKKIYSESHFLLLIRRRKRTTEANFPSKIPELMANGIAVIANRVGDYSDYLIDGENSIIVNECTSESVAQSLRRVLSMNREEISSLSYGARICAECDFDYRNKKWTEGIKTFIESCDPENNKHEKFEKEEFRMNIVEFGYKSVRSVIRMFMYIINIFYLKIMKVNIPLRSIRNINGKMFVRNRGTIIIGDNVTINSNYSSNPIGGNCFTSIYVRQGARLTIGDNSGISNTAIVCSKEINIGKYVFIGGDCKIYDTDFHSLNFEKRFKLPDDDVKTGTVNIKDGAFVGTGTIILKGVTIGEKSIIGAGSVVTCNIPDNEIWAGNPARFIRKNT